MVPRRHDKLTLERGFCKKTSPAYVHACCALRGVTATNIGISMYLDNFDGPEEEKVGKPLILANEECCPRGRFRRNEDVGQINC